jgi:hypothetical protein
MLRRGKRPSKSEEHAADTDIVVTLQPIKTSLLINHFFAQSALLYILNLYFLFCNCQILEMTEDDSPGRRELSTP